MANKNKLSFEIAEWIDHYLGLVLCSIIGLWVKILPCPRRNALVLPKKLKAILVLKWFGLGSIVLMKDLIYSIRREYPQAKIYFLTFKSNLNLIHYLSLADETWTIDRTNLFVFLLDTLRVLLRLSFKKIDIVLDLEFYSKFSTLVAYLSGAPIRVGYYMAAFWRKSLFTHLVYFNYFRHMLDIYAMAGKEIGVSVREMPLERIRAKGENEGPVRNKLLSLHWNGTDRIIGINVNAGELAYCRRWPKECFIELINELTAFGDFTIVLVGAEEDKEYTDNVYFGLSEKAREKVVNTAGIFNLSQFLTLINLFSLLITNDSGPLHLAVMQGVPTISIWGPGTPLLYGAKDKQKHKEIYHEMACSPCMYIYRTRPGIFCGGEIPCLKSIKPKEVVEYAVEILQRI